MWVDRHGRAARLALKTDLLAGHEVQDRGQRYPLLRSLQLDGVKNVKLERFTGSFIFNLGLRKQNLSTVKLTFSCDSEKPVFQAFKNQ